jgi:hypothetical protein
MPVEWVAEWAWNTQPGWEGRAARYIGKAHDPTAKARGLVRVYQEVRTRHPSTVIDGLVSLFEHASRLRVVLSAVLWVATAMILRELVIS